MLRQFAGQKGGRAKGGHSEDDDAIDPERMPPEGEAWLDLLPGANPYDQVVAKTKGRFGYLDAKAREQSNGVLLDNKSKQHDLDLASGKSVTRADHIRDIRTIVDAIIADLSPLADAAVNYVPPEQQPRMRHTMDQAIIAFRLAAAARIPKA